MNQSSEVERRLAQLQTWVIAGLAFCVVFVVTMTLVLFWQATKSGKETANRQAQLQYLCSTTGVLDDLVVAAAFQLEQNFKNGTYDKLKDQGILSQQNIDAARDTLAQYKASHERLTQAPC